MAWFIFVSPSGGQQRPQTREATDAAGFPRRCSRWLDLDQIQLNRIEVWFFRWSMVFPENRLPLFGIML